jgi:predicted ribosomally synthesized peptide with SipW-like signal peptide
MASNSKKRRRVLGVSCILAALIIASSSFAWFTSKDEVTNRLTANADYGVSIVESFVPPKNMLPGQQVNKDVYAVNTGTIGAFVKETVSGKLNYTYEKRVTTAPDQEADATERAKYVELDENVRRAIDGSTSQEAGGYLAYSSAIVLDSTTYSVDGTELTYTALDTPESATVESEPTEFPYKFTEGNNVYYATANTNGADLYAIGVGVATKVAGKTLTVVNNYVSAIKPGPVNSATLTDVAESNDGVPTDNPGQVKGDRWHPTETGVYIFRRSVGGTVDNPTYKYAGYYYVGTGVDDNPDTTDVDESEGKYYKIVIGNDTFRSNNDNENGDTIPYTMDGDTRHFEFDISVDEAKLGTGVTVDRTTGQITGDVPVQYLKNITVKDAQVNFEYHDSDADGVVGGPAYLRAWYTDTANGGSASADLTLKEAALAAAQQALADAKSDLIDAQRDAATTEVTYENALGAYNTAMSRYQQALADWNYAKALSEATTTLMNAAQTRGNAEATKDDAMDAMDAALKALKDQVNNELEADPTSTTEAHTGATKFGNLLILGDDTDISYKSIFQTPQPGATDPTLETTINSGVAGNVGNQPLMQQAKNYMDQMKAIWSTRNATDDTKKDTVDGNIVDASARLKKAVNDFDNLNTNYNGDDGDRAKAMLAELKEARDVLETLLKEYQQQYASLKRIAESEPTLTELAINESAIAGKIANWLTEIDNMKTRIEINNDDTNVGTSAFNQTYGTEILVKDYDLKYKEYIRQITEVIPEADQTWMNAVTAYNNAVGDVTVDGVDGAQKVYKAAIMKDQRSNDVNNHVAKNDYEGLTTDGKTNLTDNADNKNIDWYLTNNNDKLVAIYSAERHIAPDANTLANPQVVAADSTEGLAGLWKTIGAAGSVAATDGSGYTKQSDNSTVLAATVEAKYERANGTTITENKYTRATEATTAGKSVYKTLIGDAHSGTATYLTVETLENLVADTAALKTAVDAAEAAYQEQLDNITDAETRIATLTNPTTGTIATAQADVDAAAAKDESAITFIVYLDDPETELNWTPGLANGQSATAVPFYYNYVLDGGATSDKLIDAVKLDESVSAKDYKSLTFDLDVTLDSAQVTYAADQTTITADAATGLGNTITDIDQETKAVTWTPADGSVAPTTYTYRVGLTNVDAPISLGADTITVATGEGAGTYTYKLTVGTDTYYGTANTDGAKYVGLKDIDTTTPAVDTDVTPVTLTVKAKS